MGDFNVSLRERESDPKQNRTWGLLLRRAFCLFASPAHEWPGNISLSAERFASLPVRPRGSRAVFPYPSSVFFLCQCGLGVAGQYFLIRRAFCLFASPAHECPGNISFIYIYLMDIILLSAFTGYLHRFCVLKVGEKLSVSFSMDGKQLK